MSNSYLSETENVASVDTHYILARQDGTALVSTVQVPSPPPQNQSPQSHLTTTRNGPFVGCTLTPPSIPHLTPLTTMTKQPLPRQIDSFYDEAYHSASASSRHAFWLIILALGIANCGDATEISCMNFILSNKGFQEEMLEGDFKKRGALIASSIFVGMLFGGLMAGAYSDRVGRRPILLLGLLMNAISGTFSALSVNVAMLCLCRMGSGLGVGAVVSSLITLTTELSPPSHRGFYVTVVAAFWTVGAIFVALLAMVIFGQYNASWRIFALCCAVPSALAFIMVYIFVPESARYLALHGKYVEATKSANQVAHAFGYRGAPLDIEEVQSLFPNRGGSLVQMTSAKEH
eukprot:12603172-Ditylum_brightwellii.AAC.1